MPTKLPHLPDEYHYAIASVAVRAAQLDHHIEKVIDLALRDKPETAKFLLKNLGADRVVSLMHALLVDTFPEETESLPNLMTLINRVRSERNEVIHWLWGHNLIDGKMPLLRHRPYRESQLKYKNAEDIQQVADDAYDASRALLEWQSTLGASIRKASAGILTPPTPPTNSH